MTKIVTLLTCVLSLVLAHSAFADTIVFFNTVQQVLVYDEVSHSYAAQQYSLAQGPFANAVSYSSPSGASGTAAIDSSINANFLGGNGTASSTGPTGPTLYTESSVFGDFEITVPYQANLLAWLFGDGSGYGWTFLKDVSTGAYLTEVRNMGQNGTMVADFNGLLDPGRYQFYIAAASQVDGSATGGSAAFDGGLSLTPTNAAPVPEPASLTLLGIGLAGAAIRRRRPHAGADARS
jgi:hypothetical protein